MVQKRPNDGSSHIPVQKFRPFGINCSILHSQAERTWARSALSEAEAILRLGDSHSKGRAEVLIELNINFRYGASHRASISADAGGEYP
jgi:hypothetical protein